MFVFCRKIIKTYTAWDIAVMIPVLKKFFGFLVLPSGKG